jgi:flavodoxin
LLTWFSTQYELPTGEILGDPAQVQLTKDIISLGWQTPSPKTRWDILPLVTMAEDDKPMFATLPPALTRLVSIEHPHYPKIADLGLKWCRFPALSRLGFDIGGIQYTASPFIGWFMDAEIGVRNLADTFRYNVLPYVARAIGWNGPDYTFDDLPDHERLLWLSRAQAELNFAVYCSFLKAGVTCTSSLTASQSWTEFDDQHFREKGYRLNADPYWISPPQGSIVPLWHRGGAPNYQPKPLIARHRCDPVKVWKRRNSSFAPVGEQFDRGTTTQVLEDEVDLPHSKVHIFYCGTSGTASSLAERLRKLMTKKSSRAIGEFGTLNSFNPRKMHLEDTILFIVSTTGKGEIPSNGQQFMKRLLDPQVVPQSLRFSIFGIGDSGYHQTFNAASKSVHHIFEERKLTPLLLNCVVESDVAVESPPWTDFRAWWDRVEKALDGEVEDGSVELPKKEYIRTLYEQQYDILQAYKEATMDFDLGDHRSGGILKLSLEIPEPEYEVMGHIRLLPRNSEAMVDRVMELLGINDHQVIGTVSQQNFENPFSPGQMLTETQVHLPQVPIRQFLTNFIDLRSPFLSMDWALNLSNIKSKSAFQVLEYLSPALTHQAPSFSPEKLLLSMTPLRPRCYSIASSSINKSIPGTSLQNSPMGDSANTVCQN